MGLTINHQTIQAKLAITGPSKDYLYIQNDFYSVNQRW